jgi:hypothetical protein
VVWFTKRSRKDTVKLMAIIMLDLYTVVLKSVQCFNLLSKTTIIALTRLALCTSSITRSLPKGWCPYTCQDNRFPLS